MATCLVKTLYTITKRNTSILEKRQHEHHCK